MVDYRCRFIGDFRGKQRKRREQAKMRFTLDFIGFYGVFVGGQERDRTADTRIFSPLLYQLSYLAEKIEMVGAQGFEPWTQ